MSANRLVRCDWRTIVPELPGCSAHGDSQDVALANINDAVTLWVETAQEFGTWCRFETGHAWRAAWRMLAMAARAMDVRSVSLDPGSDCPASQVTDHHIAAAYDDLDAARELADRSDVVTYEFENVDATAIEVISELKPVYPSPSVLRVCQDREIEKDTLSALGIPVPVYRIVRSVEETVSAVDDVGLPVVMKTVRWGYDGKGQRVVRKAGDAADAFSSLGGSVDAPVIVESLVDFAMEVSVVCARDQSGTVRTFPVSENVHVDGILDTSIVPARCSDAVKARSGARGEGCR